MYEAEIDSSTQPAGDEKRSRAGASVRTVHFVRRCALGALVIGILTQALGCGSVDDGSEPVVSKPQPQEITDAQPGSLVPPVLTSCRADSDCKTVTDNCGQCACRALVKDGSLPKCTGGNTVFCAVDPCRGKQAVCARGQCILSSDESSM